MTPSSGKKAFAEGIDDHILRVGDFSYQVVANPRALAISVNQAHAKAVSAAVREFAERAAKKLRGRPHTHTVTDKCPGCGAADEVLSLVQEPPR